MRSNNSRAGQLLLSAVLLGLLPIGMVQADNTASNAKLNKPIDNVTFKDAEGKPFALHDLKEKKAVVVVFLSFDCPVSTNYSQTLAHLAKTYADKGVAFVGVSINEDEAAAELAKQVKSFAIPFPVFKDQKGAAVDALKAEVTPEAFVLDHHFILRYRGRIDNAWAARLKKNQNITSHDLQKALDELVAGKPVSEPATLAVGCPIHRDRTAPATAKVTYYKDVLPILQNHCQACHRPGEVGPFSLMTYKQAVNWASDIKDYTQSRKMPPWKPAEGVPFHNERRLTDKEIATLAAWANGGTPEGAPKDAPPPRQFTEGWQLGKPDLILTPKEDFVLGPSGRDLFRVMVLPTNLTEDKYVVAVEVKPSNPRVVHHTLNFIDATGQGRRMETAAQEKEKDQKETDVDRGPGYSVGMGVGFLPQGGLGGWAPGQLARELPEGYGFYLPKNSDVVVQVHYHRNGRVERDRVSIGLYFAKKTEGMKRFKGGVIPGAFFAIPAGNERFKVTGRIPVVEDCLLHSVMPHMHLIGKEIKVTLKPMEGNPITLVNITDWDYNWQETYFLKEPMKLKAGSSLEVEAIYDNSGKNPNNPFNPPRIITLGEQTTNEMCFVFLGATSDGPGRSPFGGRIGNLRPPDRKEEPKP